MDRRSFLKGSGIFAASLIGNSRILEGALLREAEAQTAIPLASLRSALPATQALLLVPTDAKFATYETSFNLRTQLTPQVRVLCNTPQAVATTVQWAVSNNVPFAIRGGGHSYEGLSQSPSVVIDGRGMSQIAVSADKSTVSVGTGAALGDIYSALAPYNLALPAGSCPTVGVSGHTLGGGFGLLGRALGLACDSLQSATLVDASGAILNVSATENADLYWALRGGGSGSFGVVTTMVFTPHPLTNVTVFDVSWSTSAATAIKIMAAWQAWAATAPSAISFIFRVVRLANGNIECVCAGQTTGTQAALVASLKSWTGVAPTASFTTTTMSWINSTKHFAGTPGYPACYMKGKSDYLYVGLSTAGITALVEGIAGMPSGILTAICDHYGGAIANVPIAGSAFVHRNAAYSIQYFSQWSSASDTPKYLAASRGLYASMRSHVSGHSYVNYCDLDLPSYANAYWGTNLPRLVQIKQARDPKNVFKHAQSIPLTA